MGMSEKKTSLSIIEMINKIWRNSETLPEKIRHVCDPATEEFWHLDENYNIWTCNCKRGELISLCLSICSHLETEGQLREVKREISKKRKELGLLQTDI